MLSKIRYSSQVTLRPFSGRYKYVIPQLRELDVVPILIIGLWMELVSAFVTRFASFPKGLLAFSLDSLLAFCCPSARYVALAEGSQ